MSYSILYRVMHIRLSDNTYVPMCECGDNNVYDTNRRRYRSWATHFTYWHKKLSYTADEIRETIEGIIRRDIEGAMKWETTQSRTYEEIFKDYGSYSCVSLYGHDHDWMSGTQFLNFWMKGIKNSVDFAFLLEHGICVSLWDGKDHHYVLDEQALIEAYDRITKETGHTPSIYFGDVSDFVYQLACHQHDTEPKEKLPLLNGYAIRLNLEGNYVNKITSRRMFYTWCFDRSIKVYTTRAAAAKAAEAISKRFSQYSPILVCVRRDTVTSQWQITQTA